MIVRRRFFTSLGAVVLVAAALVSEWTVFGDEPYRLEPLPPPVAVDSGQAALGRRLFFDPRLSGDGSISCATCHQPDAGWSDGLPLSVGYPGSLYFRNTPTVLNAAYGVYSYWDGRLPATDLPTVVRDHLTEAHFMQADGRLLIERLRQIPEYEEGFKKSFGSVVSYGKILNAVAAYVKTLRSKNAAFDRHLSGDETSLSADAKAGLALFQGKAGCIRCHHGPMLSDGRSHAIGAPENADVFGTPERHITFRRFFKTLGISDYASLREDIGRYAATKEPRDRNAFRTPTLRELTRTAPYMHSGMFKSLAEVVDFYNRGAGIANRAGLRPLRLSPSEQKFLIEFLKSLSGDEMIDDPGLSPMYRLRTMEEN